MSSNIVMHTTIECSTVYNPKTGEFHVTLDRKDSLGVEGAKGHSDSQYTGTTSARDRFTLPPSGLDGVTQHMMAAPYRAIHSTGEQAAHELKAAVDQGQYDLAREAQAVQETRDRIGGRVGIITPLGGILNPRVDYTDDELEYRRTGDEDISDRIFRESTKAGVTHVKDKKDGKKIHLG